MDDPGSTRSVFSYILTHGYVWKSSSLSSLIIGVNVNETACDTLIILSNYSRVRVPYTVDYTIYVRKDKVNLLS